MQILNSWTIKILIATMLFVYGQILLKTSFTINKTSFNSVAIVFGMFIGIASLIYWLFLNTCSEPISIDIGSKSILYAALAGLVFFIGNLLWIYTISENVQLGNIRTIMAGFEMMLLFFAGSLLFNDHIKGVQLFGVSIVLLGIYIIANV
jgi:drug/metabolite transporter (DMT)-like permease|uniref:EamA domain-containing protein n=1 Tax=viral metagenome TaxID=1070528 RepID=A0A6C0JCC5_9ZZZZ